MGAPTDKADFVLGPIHPQTAQASPNGTAIAAPRASQLVSGTGSTPATHSVGMAKGAFATYKNGAGVDVYVVCSSNGTTPPAAHSVSTPWYPLVGGEPFNWIVEDGLTNFIWVYATDGSSAYQGTVYTSSPM